MNTHAHEKRPNKKKKQQNNASLDESVGDREILKRDKDVC